MSKIFQKVETHETNNPLTNHLKRFQSRKRQSLTEVQTSFEANNKEVSKMNITPSNISNHNHQDTEKANRVASTDKMDEPQPRLQAAELSPVLPSKPKLKPKPSIKLKEKPVIVIKTCPVETTPPPLPPPPSPNQPTRVPPPPAPPLQLPSEASASHNTEITEDSNSLSPQTSDDRGALNLAIQRFNKTSLKNVSAIPV